MGMHIRARGDQSFIPTGCFVKTSAEIGMCLIWGLGVVAAFAGNKGTPSVSACGWLIGLEK